MRKHTHTRQHANRTEAEPLKQALAGPPVEVQPQQVQIAWCRAACGAHPGYRGALETRPTLLVQALLLDQFQLLRLKVCDPLGGLRKLHLWATRFVEREG